MFMQLLEDLSEKQKHEEKIQEELEELKDILRSDKQNLAELTSDRDKFRSLCDEKDSEIQVIMIMYMKLLVSTKDQFLHFLLP